MIGIGIAVVAIAAVLFFMNSGGSGGESNGGSSSAAKPAAAQKSETPPANAPTLANEQGRAGKTPKTPAPAIAQSDLATAESEYQASLAKWTEAEQGRQAGDHDKFKTALTEASDAMKRADRVIERYRDWLNEAEFESWAIPGEYVALQQRMGVWDRHMAKVKKAKPRD
jgi:hypothetical protein